METILRHYEGIWRRQAGRVAGDEADDVLQEVMLRAYLRYGEIPMSDGELVGKLNAMVRTGAVDVRRRRFRRSVTDIFEMEESIPDQYRVGDEIEDRELAAQAKDVLAHLSSEEQDLARSLAEGKTTTEIAAELHLGGHQRVSERRMRLRLRVAELSLARDGGAFCEEYEPHLAGLYAGDLDEGVARRVRLHVAGDEEAAGCLVCLARLRRVERVSGAIDTRLCRRVAAAILATLVSPVSGAWGAVKGLVAGSAAGSGGIVAKATVVVASGALVVGGGTELARQSFEGSPAAEAPVRVAASAPPPGPAAVRATVTKPKVKTPVVKPKPKKTGQIAIAPAGGSGRGAVLAPVSPPPSPPPSTPAREFEPGPSGGGGVGGP